MLQQQLRGSVEDHRHHHHRLRHGPHHLHRHRAAEKEVEDRWGRSHHPAEGPEEEEREDAAKMG